MPYFEVLKNKNDSPLLVHIPHASSHIPPEVRDFFILTDVDLAKELICMTDAYTDELLSGMGITPGVVMVNRLSRLVMDPERFPNDENEVMSSKGMGAIYTKTSSGADLKRPMNTSEKASFINQFYMPYHDCLTKEATRLLETFNQCLIVDGHSFPSKPLSYELDQLSNRPDVCIGTDACHTPRLLQDFCMNFWESKGYTVGLNKPFSGSLVPLEYYRKDQRIQSIMIEIRRGLYMNETSGKKNVDFYRLKKVADDFLEELCMKYLKI